MPFGVTVGLDTFRPRQWLRRIIRHSAGTCDFSEEACLLNSDKVDFVPENARCPDQLNSRVPSTAARTSPWPA